MDIEVFLLDDGFVFTIACCCFAASDPHSCRFDESARSVYRSIANDIGDSIPFCRYRPINLWIINDDHYYYHRVNSGSTELKSMTGTTETFAPKKNVDSNVTHTWTRVAQRTRAMSNEIRCECVTDWCKYGVRVLTRVQRMNFDSFRWDEAR